MATKYPILLVHGIAMRELPSVKSFGGVKKALEQAGNRVYPSDTDAYGPLEKNAELLKAQILRVLEKEGAEKVNLIAHSKGGLDARYMIARLGMADRVASLITVSTPHLGSKVATWLFRFPLFMLKPTAFFVDLWFRIARDKHPDSLTVCRQLRASPNVEIDGLLLPETVFCRSYSSTMKHIWRDIGMGFPYLVTKCCEKSATDGLVAVSSAAFGDYCGDMLDCSLSHAETMGFCLNPNKRKRVVAFYVALAEELASLGM